MLAELLELAPSGLEETDRGDGTIEYAVYGAPGELPELPALKAAAGGALVDVCTAEVDQGWEERWRQFHRPLVIDHRLTVRPPWERAGDTEIDIVIDPGRAFGTGAHATTRLCLELLLELAPRGGPFLDLGCGSGVLAIAAARLGFDPVIALDIDRAAVRAAVENAARNGVEVEVRRFDLRRDQLPRAHTAVANLLAPLLLDWVRAGEELPTRVIASGLLEHEGERIVSKFSQRGLTEVDRRVAGGWLAVLLER